MRRRHLTTGQRAAVALAALPLYEAEAAKKVGGRPAKDPRKPGADLHQVSDEPAPKRQRAPRSADKAAKAERVGPRGKTFHVAGLLAAC